MRAWNIIRMFRVVWSFSVHIAVQAHSRVSHMHSMDALSAHSSHTRQFELFRMVSSNQTIVNVHEKSVRFHRTQEYLCSIIIWPIKYIILYTFQFFSALSTSNRRYSVKNVSLCKYGLVKYKYFNTLNGRKSPEFSIQ